MPHSRARREIFLYFYTDVLLLFLRVYMYAYKAIKRNNVQSVSLGIGNYSFLFGSHKEWLNSQHKMVLPLPALTGLAILPLFLIPSSLILFLLYILSFFLTLRLLSLCSPILSHINVLLSFPPVPFLSQSYLGLNAPSPLSCRRTRNVLLFSHGASLNSGVKSLILNVLV